MLDSLIDPWINSGSWILPDPVEESDPQVGTSSSSNSCSADPQAGTSSSSNSCNVKNSTTTSTTTLSNNTTIVSTLPKQRRKYSIGSGTSVPQEKATKPPETSAKPEDTVNKLPAHLMNYYLEIAEIIIVNNNENLLRVALKDLRTNPKIAPLCPYFLNLVAISVLEFQGNGRLLDALIRTVDALVDNPYFDPSSHLATNRGLTALVNIATGPHVAKGWDDMLLRRQSATILGKVMNHWVIEQKQQENLVRRLSDLMFRGTYVSLKSHFGAVVILSTFGDRVLNTEFWPQIHHYFNLLDNLLNFDTAEDIHFVKGAILMAAEGMLKRFHYAAHTTNKEVKRLQDVSNQLYEYFGDTLIPWFYLKVLGTSVYPPVVTVPVERKLPIFRKENMRFDHDYCFKSCNYVIILQHQLQLTYTLNILGTALVQKPKIDTNSVFAVEPWHSKTLRKKNLDNTQNYYDNRVHKFPQMWYRQTIFKCTRTIKNCLPSHKKSGAGDLFMLI